MSWPVHFLMISTAVKHIMTSVAFLHGRLFTNKADVLFKLKLSTSFGWKDFRKHFVPYVLGFSVKVLTRVILGFLLLTVATLFTNPILWRNSEPLFFWCPSFTDPFFMLTFSASWLSILVASFTCSWVSRISADFLSSWILSSWALSFCWEPLLIYLEALWVRIPLKSIYCTQSSPLLFGCALSILAFSWGIDFCLLFLRLKVCYWFFIFSRRYSTESRFWCLFSTLLVRIPIFVGIAGNGSLRVWGMNYLVWT